MPTKNKSMSTYIKETKNPLTGKWVQAIWIYDHFGSHLYGVSFKNEDGTQSILDPREYDFEVRQATDDGKKIETKEHADGHKDVKIHVKRLDVNPEEGDEGGKKAKKLSILQ